MACAGNVQYPEVIKWNNVTIEWGRVLTYASKIQHAEVIKWNDLTIEWGRYNTMTTLATQTQLRCCRGLLQVHKWHPSQKDTKNTEQQNCKRNNKTTKKQNQPVCWQDSEHSKLPIIRARRFFYINADTCELCFWQLSTPASEGGRGVVLCCYGVLCVT
jgi:hypothetical protein